ncbi:MAG: hypothetical protein MJ218_03515 [Opitutales bacterium]|nr:hypothetical protein [Opitutales bacterium]
MKITLNSHVLSGGEKTNEAITRLEITAHWTVQWRKAIHADFAKALGRDNQQTEIVLEVSKRHASKAEAIQYSLTHASQLIHAKGQLSIDFEDPSAKQTTLLEDATLCTIQTHSKGNASYTLYKIYGGNLHETK